MSTKRTSYAVYDTKYHSVWAPKYRKWIVREDIRRRVEPLFRQIAEDFSFEIDELEVGKDHVHLFLNFPPRYAIAKVVGILKSVSASRVFKEFLDLKRQLWKGEFWEDGYFARTVGDAVTASVIRRYIRYQRHEEHEGTQLKLFEISLKAPPFGRGYLLKRTCKMLEGHFGYCFKRPVTSFVTKRSMSC